MTIYGLGEVVLDIIFKGDSPVASVPGGSTFNALLSLGRTLTDVRVCMISKIGEDRTGKFVRSFLEKNGVSSDYVCVVEGAHTNISLAFLDEDNNASYEFYKDSRLNGAPFTTGCFKKGDILLLGSFYAINPLLREGMENALSSARVNNVISYYDINFRKNYIKERDRYLPYILQNIESVNFVKASTEDLEFLFPGTSAESIYEEYVRPRGACFIVTDGAAPVRVFTPDSVKTFDVTPVKPVSTIGAGDSFNAGFIYGLVSSGIKPGSPLTDDIWQALVKSAMAFSADVCCSMENFVSPSFAAKLKSGF